MSLLDRMLPWRRSAARILAMQEAEQARQVQLSGVLALRREARDRQRERDAGRLIVREP